MSKSLEALKKIWHYAIQEHNNLFINDVFDNCYMPIKQDLELLGSLKQIWNNQEFCKGIPLSADGLNSLFNYNLDMFNKNLELDKKVLDLEKENQELKTTLLEYKAQENLYWTTATNNANLREENEKLKKAVEILKDKLKLSLNDNKATKTINAVLPIGNNDMNRLTQQEYELISEVLE